MSLGSGLSAQLGFAEESVYGTYVAPTRFLPFDREALRLNIERDEFAGSIGETGTVLRSDRWAAGARNVSGEIALKVLTRGFGMLFRHMLGAVAISTPGGATLTRDHTHTLANLLPLSLTAQVGRPGVTGPVRPFSYLGCKIAEWTLSNALKGFLEIELSIDGRNEDTVPTLAAASFPSGAVPLHWAGGSVTVAGAAFPLHEITINCNNGLEGDRYHLSSNVKSPPLHERLREITGEMVAEFTDLQAYNRFVTGAHAGIVATWTGPIIESTFNNHVQVTLPVCRFDGETPRVDGHGRLMQRLPFKVLNDGTQQPITLVYRTADVAS